MLISILFALQVALGTGLNESVPTLASAMQEQAADEAAEEPEDDGFKLPASAVPS